MDETGEMLRIPPTDDQTIEELKQADLGYADLTLRSCEGGSIQTEQGSGFGVEPEKLEAWRAKTGKEPEQGMALRLYSSMGLIHGCDLDGVEIFWQTPAERVVERAKWLADYDRKQREKFAGEREKLDTNYMHLPPPLKARIDRFRQQPGFRATAEGYEMFCCMEAMRFTKRAQRAAVDQENKEEMEAFWKDPPDKDPWATEPDSYAEAWFLWVVGAEQHRLLGADPEHTGNTFGAAIGMALELLRNGDEAEL